MTTKPELFSAWLTKATEIATALSMPLSFAGVDVSTGLAFEEDADTPYLKASFIWGQESRPYLNGLDGQQHISIVQIAAVYPKIQQFSALDTACSVKALVPLDSVVGVPVFNAEISPVIYTESRVMHVVSFTLKVV